jgi:hypothetical protein
MTVEQENELFKTIQKLRNDLEELKIEVRTPKVDSEAEKKIYRRSVTTNHNYKKIKTWLLTNYQYDMSGIEIFADMKSNYLFDFPQDEVSDATFGKVIKAVFPVGTVRNTKIRGFATRIYKLKHRK